MYVHVHQHAYVYVLEAGAEPYAYIGQTARTWFTGDVRTDLEARVREHLEDKWWAYTITGVRVHWYGSCTQDDLDKIERLAIRTYRPLHNIEHNRNNPRRIKPWDAEAAARAIGYVPPKPSRTYLRTRRSRAYSSTRQGSGTLGFVVGFALTLFLMALCLSLISRGL